MNTQEAYRVLGLSAGATADDVKRAYRQKALEYHPDRFQDDRKKAFYERRFMDAREAYACLRSDAAVELPEESEVVPEMGSWVAGRSFAATDVEPVSQAEKLGLRSPWSLETLLVWVGGTALAVVVLVYVFRFLADVVRGGNP
ncbi:MAG: J domain-containing protein [Elusimicrobia bacterium]|nr:J domain-containing protein [Elusimicrobiota bacterium]